jgi:hypothetical protein
MLGQSHIFWWLLTFGSPSKLLLPPVSHLRFHPAEGVAREPLEAPHGPGQLHPKNARAELALSSSIWESDRIFMDTSTRSEILNILNS